MFKLEATAPAGKKILLPYYEGAAQFWCVVCCGVVWCGVVWCGV
jgi:hypothetical protein